ncbi:MAG TPA: hypothetical protein VGM92_04840 [Candidatus Kapabacteria bacterium]|jgi:hypothetical protein
MIDKEIPKPETEPKEQVRVEIALKDGEVIDTKVTKYKQCPNNPKHTGTILLQGDPHVRCTWCHAALDN